MADSPANGKTRTKSGGLFELVAQSDRENVQELAPSGRCKGGIPGPRLAFMSVSSRVLR
jgi:hypothetical protein